MEFLGQMLFGIQASRDTLMSEIARSLQEDILAKKTQERLERHLATEGMDSKVHGSILCDAAPGIHDDTLIIVDPTDVQKGYAEKMPYLAKALAPRRLRTYTSMERASSASATTRPTYSGRTSSG